MSAINISKFEQTQETKPNWEPKKHLEAKIQPAPLIQLQNQNP